MSTLSKTEINRRTAERFLNGTHSRNIADVDVIDDIVGPHITCHGFPGTTITDHESYKDFFRTFRQSFTDMDWKVHALVADGMPAASICSRMSSPPANTGKSTSAVLRLMG
jgi:hypothetical protein